MIRRFLIAGLAGSAAVPLALLVGDPASGATALTPGQAVRAVASSLASGDGSKAARLICENRLESNPSLLGHALSGADLQVIAAGGYQSQIDRFADAVNNAYGLANISKPVAGASMALGLVDIVKGSTSAGNAVTFWGDQASIGSGIIVRVTKRWVFEPKSTPVCSGLR